MSDIYLKLIDGLVKLIIVLISAAFSSIIIPWAKNTVVPWLREKRLYSVCVKFVMAAEKMAESGAIKKLDKKQMVVDLLIQKGIEITPEVNAYIESAVKELDYAFTSGMGQLLEEFREE